MDGLRLAQWAISITVAVGIVSVPLGPLFVATLGAGHPFVEDPSEEAAWTRLDTLPPLPPLPPMPVASLAKDDEAAAQPVAAVTPKARNTAPKIRMLPTPVAAAPSTAELDNDGLADARAPDEPGESIARKHRPFKRHKGHPGVPTTPCAELNPAIEQQGEGAFSVNREILEYYSSHLAELESLGGVATHRNKESGEKDGFRVGLKRCGLLYQAGLRSGDVVNSINDRRIVSVLQAVGAYIALRKEPELVVSVTRRGEPLQLIYSIQAKEPRHRGRSRRSSL